MAERTRYSEYQNRYLMRYPTSSHLSQTGHSQPGRSATRPDRPSRSTSWSGSTTHWRPGEEAIGHLNGIDIDELPDEATTLLHMLYSLILVSYAVNVFKQNRIPDSGAAFFGMVAEPAV